MFIDNAYFVGDISLPGSVLSGSLANIDNYIDKYEKEVLIDLLGYTLYKELAAQKTADSLDLKWTAFVNGAEYTVSYNGADHTVKWNGIVNDDKISFLAYYVYFHFLRDNVTSTTLIGEVLNKNENSTRITPADKMVYAYNRFVRLYGSVNDGELVPSAYRYLEKHEDDFNDLWVFTQKDHINTFGI